MSSEEARQRGNALYKKGQLKEAEAAYKKAATLAPEDPAPLSNLSSVNYELGKYAEAAKYARTSLELTEKAGSDDEAAMRKKKTLLARLAKARLYDCQLEEVKQLMDQLGDAELETSLLATIEAVEAWKTSASLKAARKLVLDRLPRFKPYLIDVPEYYAIGHDIAEPLYDPDLEKTASARDDLAFLFCGSGDARHVFMTLFRMGSLELMQRKKTCRKLHITLLDLKPAAIARTLIFFDMIMAYALMKGQKVPGIEDAPTVMAYLYLGHVIPHAVKVKLDQAIARLLLALDSDEEIFPFFFMDAATRRQVSRVLKQWQQPMTGVCSARLVRRAVRKRLRREKMQHLMWYGADKASEINNSFPSERKAWEDLTVVLPSKGFAERRDPASVPLMERYKQKLPGALQGLSDHIDNNWVTNPTLIDADYVASTRSEDAWRHGDAEEDKVPSIEADVLTEATKLLPEMPGHTVLEHVGNIFDMLAVLTIQFLPNRLMIEAMTGEMTEVMERMSHNCLPSRSTPIGGIDPSNFPPQYDRIHMSNIPDYVGGIFTAALYGRPLLKDDKPAHLKYNVLLNPPKFRTREHFRAEYMLMYDDKRVADHFALRQLPGDRHEDDDYDDYLAPMGQAVMGMDSVQKGSFMRENYQIWEQVRRTKLPLQRLLPRGALERWLYAHYLKICLPFSRPAAEGAPMHSPLNPTALLRLAAYLHTIGYPAHWLSTVLTNLCEGEITTTARAPRQISTDQSFVDTVFPSLKMTISPWRAEYTTLLSIWTPLLPFAFLAPAGSLVLPSHVVEYTVSFHNQIINNAHVRVPHFMLVFWDTSSRSEPPEDMRKFLLDDETGDTSPSARTMKQRAIHVVNTFRYVTETSTASFWLRADVMEEMKKGKWNVYIWRSDTYASVTKGVSVADHVVETRRWLDGEGSQKM